VSDEGRVLADENPPSPEEAIDRLLDDDATGGDIVEVHDVDMEPTAEDLGLELPDDVDEARRLLMRELAEARREAGEYLETLQRVAADFDNYRKRVERDSAENVMRASQRIIEHLLPTLDAFDAALAYEPQTEAEKKILDGMRGTHTAMMETLAKDGLQPIAAQGEPFDPAVHEAVGGPGGGDGELVVAQELRRGYTLHARVIRPALVMVGHSEE
jgi:molecular chaperone GrpE